MFASVLGCIIDGVFQWDLSFKGSHLWGILVSFVATPPLVSPVAVFKALQLRTGWRTESFHRAKQKNKTHWCWSLEQPLLCPVTCAAAGAGMGQVHGAGTAAGTEAEKRGLYSCCWELGQSYLWGRAIASCVTLQLPLLLCFPPFLRTCPEQQCMQFSALSQVILHSLIAAEPHHPLRCH